VADRTQIDTIRNFILRSKPASALGASGIEIGSAAEIDFAP